MSEMIERVAKALKGYEAAVLLDTGSVNPGGKEYWEGKARAAIEAMREPTAAMIDAGDDSTGSSGLAIVHWETMIDEALK